MWVWHYSSPDPVLRFTLRCLGDVFHSRILMAIFFSQEKIEEKLLSSRGSCYDQKIFVKAKDTKQGDAILNPLEEYRRFGEYVHNQEQTLEMQFDWSKWLHLTDKYPNTVLRRVILGRQEFLPESYNYLTDEEKIAHEKLLRYFEHYTPAILERPISSGSSSTRSSSVTE